MFALALFVLAAATFVALLPAVESGAVGVLFIVALPAKVASDELVVDAGGGGGGGGGGANGVCAAHEDRGLGK